MTAKSVSFDSKTNLEPDIHDSSIRKIVKIHADNSVQCVMARGEPAYTRQAVVSLRTLRSHPANLFVAYHLRMNRKKSHLQSTTKKV